MALSGAGVDARPPAEAESLWEYFHSSDVDFWDSENRLITLVLVFDQFEERFTLGRQWPETDARAEVFLTELSQLVENRPPPLLKTKFESHAAGIGNYDFDKHSCNVVLSLREDFLPELENLRDRFPSILENTLRLQAMSEAQAIEVVLGPGSHLVSGQVANRDRALCRGSRSAIADLLYCRAGAAQCRLVRAEPAPPRKRAAIRLLRTFCRAIASKFSMDFMKMRCEDFPPGPAFWWRTVSSPVLGAATLWLGRMRSLSLEWMRKTF